MAFILFLKGLLVVTVLVCQLGPSGGAYVPAGQQADTLNETAYDWARTFVARYNLNVTQALELDSFLRNVSAECEVPVRVQLDYLYTMLNFAEVAASFISADDPTDVGLIFPDNSDEVTATTLFRSNHSYTGRGDGWVADSTTAPCKSGDCRGWGAGARPLDGLVNESMDDMQDLPTSFAAETVTVEADIVEMAAPPQLLMYYRYDLFSEYGLVLPATWSELADWAARYNGTVDADGDGRGDWALCLDTLAACKSGFVLMAVMASSVQAATEYGTFFEPETMDPLVKSSAFVSSLDLFRRLASYSYPVSGGDPLSCRAYDPDFFSGRCLLTLSFDQMRAALPHAASPTTGSITAGPGPASDTAAASDTASATVTTIIASEKAEMMIPTADAQMAVAIGGGGVAGVYGGDIGSSSTAGADGASSGGGSVVIGGGTEWSPGPPPSPSNSNSGSNSSNGNSSSGSSSSPHRGMLPADALGVAPLPGSEDLLNRTSNQLLPCTLQRCPNAITTTCATQGDFSARRTCLVNRAPLIVSLEYDLAVASYAPAAAQVRLRAMEAALLESRQRWVSALHATLLLTSATNGSGNISSTTTTIAASSELSRRRGRVLAAGSYSSPSSELMDLAAYLANLTSVEPLTELGYSAAEASRFLAAYWGSLLGHGNEAVPGPQNNLVQELQIRGSAYFTNIFSRAVAWVLAGEASSSRAALWAASETDALLDLVASNRTRLSYKYCKDIGWTGYQDTGSRASRSAGDSGSGGLSGGQLAAVIVAPLCAACLVVVGVTVALVVLRRRRWAAPKALGPPGPGLGTTLILTDIQNSTVLWESLPADTMDAAIRCHHEVLRGLLPKHRGYESATEGDAFILAFHSAEDAAGYGIAAQELLLTAPWPPEMLSHPDCEVMWMAPNRADPVASLSYVNRELLNVTGRAGGHSAGAGAGPGAGLCSMASKGAGGAQGNGTAAPSGACQGKGDATGSQSPRRQRGSSWWRRAAAAVCRRRGGGGKAGSGMTAGGNAPGGGAVSGGTDADGSVDGGGGAAAAAAAAAVGHVASSRKGTAGRSVGTGGEGAGGGSGDVDATTADAAAAAAAVAAAVAPGQSTDSGVTGGGGGAGAAGGAGSFTKRVDALVGRLTRANSVRSGRSKPKLSFLLEANASAAGAATAAAANPGSDAGGGAGPWLHPLVRISPLLKSPSDIRSYMTDTEADVELSTHMPYGAGNAAVAGAEGAGSGAAAVAAATAPLPSHNNPLYNGPVRLGSGGAAAAGGSSPRAASRLQYSSGAAEAAAVGAAAAAAAGPAGVGGIGGGDLVEPPAVSTTLLGLNVVVPVSTLTEALRQGWRKVPPPGGGGGAGGGSVSTVGSALVDSGGDMGSGSGAAVEPMLAFRGMRVRMGIHTGADLSEVSLNKATGRTQYSGVFMTVAKAVCDAAHGGQVILSPTTFKRLPPGSAAARGAFIVHMGEHVLCEGDEPGPLYQLLPYSLSCRLPYFAPLRTHEYLALGLPDAPVGRVTVAFMYVVGAQTLLAWNPIVAGDALQIFHNIVSEEMHGTDGYVVELVDGLCLGAFRSAADALLWSLRCGRLLLSAPWSEELLEHELCEEVSLIVHGDNTPLGGGWGGLPTSPNPNHKPSQLTSSILAAGAAVATGYQQLQNHLHWMHNQHSMPHQQHSYPQTHHQAAQPLPPPQHQTRTFTLPRATAIRRKTLMRGLRLKVGMDVGFVADSINATTGRMAYRGRPMNRAARIASRALAGQVHCSAGVWAAAGERLALLARSGSDEEVAATSLGLQSLKGVMEKIEVMSVSYKGSALTPEESAVVAKRGPRTSTNSSGLASSLGGSGGTATSLGAATTATAATTADGSSHIFSGIFSALSMGHIGGHTAAPPPVSRGSVSSAGIAASAEAGGGRGGRGGGGGVGGGGGDAALTRSSTSGLPPLSPERLSPVFPNRLSTSRLSQCLAVAAAGAGKLAMGKGRSRGGAGSGIAAVGTGSAVGSLGTGDGSQDTLSGLKEDGDDGGGGGGGRGTEGGDGGVEIPAAVYGAPGRGSSGSVGGGGGGSGGSGDGNSLHPSPPHSLSGSPQASASSTDGDGVGEGTGDGDGDGDMAAEDLLQKEKKSSSSGDGGGGADDLGESGCVPASKAPALMVATAAAAPLPPSDSIPFHSRSDEHMVIHMNPLARVAADTGGADGRRCGEEVTRPSSLPNKCTTCVYDGLMPLPQQRAAAELEPMQAAADEGSLEVAAAAPGGDGASGSAAVAAFRMYGNRRDSAPVTVTQSPLSVGVLPSRLSNDSSDEGARATAAAAAANRLHTRFVPAAAAAAAVPPPVLTSTSFPALGTSSIGSVASGGARAADRSISGLLPMPPAPASASPARLLPARAGPTPES